jgi:hypothetical protein
MIHTRVGLSGIISLSSSAYTYVCVCVCVCVCLFQYVLKVNQRSVLFLFLFYACFLGWETPEIAPVMASLRHLPS